MRLFLLNILLFTVLNAMILIIALFLPNHFIKGSLHFALLDKHEMLVKKEPPRIIFLGGSNISFGIDSKAIQDTFNVNVINMGIDGGYGLKFILNDYIQKMKNGDLVILSPEYHHFYNFAFLGGYNLLNIIFDVA